MSGGPRRRRRPRNSVNVEQLTRTLLEDWAYSRLGSRDRAELCLSVRLGHSNHLRSPTALGNLPPITCSTDVLAGYSYVVA